MEQLEILRQRQRERLERAAAICIMAGHEAAARIGQAAHPAVQAISPRAAAIWQVARPVLLAQSRKLRPLLSLAEPASHETGEPDVVQTILGEFERLGLERQDKVAKNLALLWDNFQDMFGGISGFLAAPQAEQDAFMEKLKAASERMEPARGSEAAFHYVTVELMRQYIAFFQIGKPDRKAISLATCVVPLIERGRRMNAKPVASLIQADTHPSGVRH